MAKYTVEVTENVPGRPAKTYESEPLETMVFDERAIKRPFADIHVPEEAFGWIGKLAFIWGYFELELDGLIVALEKETGTEKASLRQQFKRRKERCRDLSKTAFAGNPAVHEALSSILGAAADLHWRRNLIVHGHCSCTLHAKGPKNGKVWIEYNLTFTSYVDDKKTSLHLKAADLERLFYAIGHVTGRMVEFIDPAQELPGLSSEDRERRQAFLRATRLKPTIPVRPPSPP